MLSDQIQISLAVLCHLVRNPQKTLTLGKLWMNLCQITTPNIVL